MSTRRSPTPARKRSALPRRSARFPSFNAEGMRSSLPSLSLSLSLSRTHTLTLSPFLSLCLCKNALSFHIYITPSLLSKQSLPSVSYLPLPYLFCLLSALLLYIFPSIFLYLYLASFLSFFLLNLPRPYLSSLYLSLCSSLRPLIFSVRSLRARSVCAAART